MRKWTFLLFVAAVLMLCLTVGTASAAAATPKLVLDGKVLTPKEPPALINSYSMVPIRTVAEGLGFGVDYDEARHLVTVQSSGTIIQMVIGEKKASVNGESRKLDAPATLVKNTTMVPLRFVGETMGLSVFWDNASKSVFLFSKGGGSVGSSQPPSGSGGSGGTNAGDGGSGNAGIPGDGGIGIVTGEDGSDAPTDGGGSSSGAPASLAQVHGIRYENGAVVIRVDGAFTRKDMAITGPDRIVVDLYNADFASDFKPTPQPDAAAASPGELPVVGSDALQKVRYAVFQDNPRVLRFVLDLSKPQKYAVQYDPGAGELRIVLNPATVPGGPGKSVYTIVLDAGHGGSDPGAPTVSGKWEKTFTLAVVLKVRQELAGDPRINVVLTRDSDTYPTLDDRVNLAESVGADLFLSVHGNSFTPNIRGTETYYTRPESLEFAKVMHAKVVAATGFPDNGVRQKSLKVTRDTTMPAVLLEIGYLSNKTDEAAMFDDAFQSRVAKAIAAGLKQYLHLN